MRTLKQLAEECMVVQNACNPLGLSKGYARALQDLHTELGRLSLPNDTMAMRLHPINVWWVDKLHDLAGRAESGFVLSEAYDAIQTIIQGDRK